MGAGEEDSSSQRRSLEAAPRSALIEEMGRMTVEASGCLERVRRGEQGALAEMKQFWQRLKGSGAACGVPAVTVLGSAFEALSEAWLRARVRGREHPDAARLTGEALELLPALARGEVPRGSGVLKDLCVRAGELTGALGRSAEETPA